MKKQAVISAGNYQNILLEDYDLWIRMLKNGCQMENLNLILGKFRTSKSMYRRRSGFKQIKKIIQIEKQLLSYGIINFVEYLLNIIIRSIVAIIPVKLKVVVYKFIIRKI